MLVDISIFKKGLDFSTHKAYSLGSPCCCEGSLPPGPPHLQWKVLPSSHLGGLERNLKNIPWELRIPGFHSGSPGCFKGQIHQV